MDGSVRKALGLIAGAPDTFLFMARGSYHGLAVEFKTETGIQSQAQKDFQMRLEMQGYKYELVRSLQEFQDVITKYLSL